MSRYQQPFDMPEFPGWHEAPDDTATHWDTQRGVWYREASGMHCEANAGSGWYRSSFGNSKLDESRFLKRPRNHQHTAKAEEQFTMTEEQAKELALDKRPMKVVEVKFQNADNAKAYHYYAPADAKSGDYAVVYSNTVATGSLPFAVVIITCDEVIDTQRATKAVLGTFNEDFAKHVQARIEHMARVKAKLQQKKKQFEESAFFEMLAQNDPEAAALLDELKSFSL